MQPSSLIFIAAFASAGRAFADPGPVECFDASSYRGIDLNQRVQLCSGAVNKAPVECFDGSSYRGLSNEQRVELCRPRFIQTRPAP